MTIFEESKFIMDQNSVLSGLVPKVMMIYAVFDDNILTNSCSQALRGHSVHINFLSRILYHENSKLHYLLKRV